MDIIWKGPDAETDIAGQIGIIEDYINNNVGAIVMAACDADALVPVIDKAHRAGIPVVVIDSGVNSTDMDVLNGKTPAKHIDTGVTIVTRQNLNDPAVEKLLNPK